MTTPVWQILAQLDRIHDLQSQRFAQSPIEDPCDSAGTVGPSAVQYGLNSPYDASDGRSHVGEPTEMPTFTRNPNPRIFPTNTQVVAATADAKETMGTQKVPINVYEAAEALVIVAPLPTGVAEDVTIELEPKVLRFHTVLRSAAPRPYLLHEWEYGGFERVLELPEGFGSTVEASLANGQLVIRVLRGNFGGRVTIHPSAHPKLTSSAS